MTIRSTSPRTTAWNHTLDAAPRATSPTTTAFSATNAEASTRGIVPSKGSSIGRDSVRVARRMQPRRRCCRA